MTVQDSKANWKAVALGLIIGVCLMQVGTMAYQDELDQQARYCKNVKSTLWPDYQKNFKDICTKAVDS